MKSLKSLALFSLMTVTCLGTLHSQQIRLPRPRVLPLKENAGFNDEPTMTQTSDGSLYIAWNSFKGGTDSLQVARYRTEGDEFISLGSWQVVGGPGISVLSPVAVPGRDSVHLVYAAEYGKNWEIYAVKCGPDGPGKPIAVTSNPGADIDPDAAWFGNTLWITWEASLKGDRVIQLASLNNGRISPAKVLSVQGRSSYDPSIAITDRGQISVAWHAFSDSNYDIFLRRRFSENGWQDVRRLTQSASIDRHAVLVPHGEELWLLYENAQTEGYLIGRTNQRSAVVAKIAEPGLVTLSGQGVELDDRSEAPAAAFDSSGRLWLAYLKPKLPRGGWQLFLSCFSGDTWIGTTQVSRRKGMDRRPSLVVGKGRVLLAFQVDDLPETWAQDDPALTSDARSLIMLGSANLNDLKAPAKPLELKPLEETTEDFEAGRLRNSYGEDAATQEIQYKGKTLKLFYGDLHAHSDISVCNRCGDQSIDEGYQHRRDLAALDFAAITDHGYNLIPYLWSYTAKLARANEDSGRLVTFLAQEWTSSTERYTAENPYGYYGHRNLILEDPFFPRWWNAASGQTPLELWQELRMRGASFVNIPHQLADTGNVPTDWRFSDVEAQPVAEIFQVRGSYEYHGTPRQARRSIQEPGRYLQDTWEVGNVIGVIASPDHGGGLGKACVFAEGLTRRHILEAIRQRHTFGTTASRMFLDVRVNGHLMGEVVEDLPDTTVQVEIRVQCPSEIDRIEVCRNNRFIYLSQPEGSTAELKFVDTSPLDGPSYYYVRVVQTDGEIGWTSPVWLGRVSP